MAESQKKDSSSVSLKEKNSLLDLDIGKDFLSSWKSISIAQGDAMDFDITPVTKGNKKSFDFDKADMDFNLDGDFGKLPSFNMDMSDLDISPPLKKDGKSKEKPEESSAGKDKGKNDRFAFAFDFDELENFSFESSLTKEEPKAQKETNNKGSSPKAQKDKNNKGSSTNGSGFQDKEASMNMNLLENVSNLEDRPMKPSLPGTKITFDMDIVVGGTADLENTREICLPNFAMDDAVTSEQASAVDEAVSDKTRSLPEKTIASRELPKISPSEKLISPEPDDFQASTGNDLMQDLSSDYLSKNEPGGGNSSDMVDFMDTKASGSSGGKETSTDEPSIADSTCNYIHTMSDNSEPLQTVAISEKDDGAKSQVGVEDHVRGNRERTEPGQANSLVANSCATSSVPGISCDTPSGREKQEPASEICKLPLISQPVDLSEKDAEKRSEPLVTCSRYFSQSEKTEYPMQKSSIQTTFSSLSSKTKMGLSLPSLVQGRDLDNNQSDSKLVSLPLQHSKPPLRRELSQVRSQESCEGPKICRDVPGRMGLQIEKKLYDSSTMENKDMVKTKSAMRQRETSMKDLDILSSSMEVNRKAAQSSGNETSLASSPTIKRTPADEHKLSSIDDGKKTVGLSGLKLSGKFVDTSEKVLDKKVPNPNTMEDDGIKSSLSSKCQISTFHVPNDGKIKGVEMSFSIENSSNIKHAEAYGKELDDLCNMLRRKHDEAKEILVKAIVNSNKLLLLNNPFSEEKISFKRFYFLVFYGFIFHDIV
ncbi:hypothetical protein Salat_2643500 [Sesamum alatum]|uniref:Uncharacterized protein n=1 Tax=Sesamum alatum TaxID=300844 RepID=A0AAE1XP11_9LAMI|nr:hypothetical protein Salat_2643500 [Sesamum alatum]